MQLATDDELGDNLLMSTPSLSLTLRLRPERFAACRLDPDQGLPAWLGRLDFWAASRTPDELTLIVPEEMASERWRREDDFRALIVDGPLDFSAVGILADLAGALAAAGISLLAVSTFDTDVLLVRERDLAGARTALEGRGHTVLG